MCLSVCATKMSTKIVHQNLFMFNIFVFKLSSCDKQLYKNYMRVCVSLWQKCPLKLSTKIYVYVYDFQKPRLMNILKPKKYWILLGRLNAAVSAGRGTPGQFFLEIPTIGVPIQQRGRECRRWPGTRKKMPGKLWFSWKAHKNIFV